MAGWLLALLFACAVAYAGKGAGFAVYTAWEVARHPDRFHEVVVYRSLERMELLTSVRSALAGLANRIEACWRPGRPVMHPAGWAVFPERRDDESRRAFSASSGRPREDRVL